MPRTFAFWDPISMIDAPENRRMEPLYIFRGENDMFRTISDLMIAAHVRRQSGQAMVEYGLILGLVSVVGVAVLGIIGGQLGDVFQAISDQLTAALAA